METPIQNDARAFLVPSEEMGDDDVSTEAETERTKETYYEVLAASSVGWNEARVFHFWEIEKHAPGFRRAILA